jgi:hypothetical protein
MEPNKLAFPHLKRKEQRGSKPRCHLLTDGSNREVAARLSGLLAPFATVAASDQWMPRGFESIEECQLHRRSPVLDSNLCDQLAAWWLPANQRTDRTPNFDIASTCLIDGRPGIVLVEAKAHDNELIRESAGRKVTSSDPSESRASRESSHATIGTAIEQARTGLSAETGLGFGISRDRCYQMSNRFAWAWKIAASGVPVVLMYLGFLDAEDMATGGKPFRTHDEWEELVRSHGASIVPDAIWNQRQAVEGQQFLPIIRSALQPLAVR